MMTGLANTCTVYTFAALAEEKIVAHELLAPHARWQARITVGDESLAQAGQVAIGRDRQLTTGKGNNGGWLARMVQNATEEK
jgi:hypothetical protein